MKENLLKIRAFIDSSEFDEGLKLVEAGLKEDLHNRELVDLQIELYIKKYKNALQTFNLVKSEKKEQLTAGLKESDGFFEIPEIKKEIIPARKEEITGPAETIGGMTGFEGKQPEEDIRGEETAIIKEDKIEKELEKTEPGTDEKIPADKTKINLQEEGDVEDDYTNPVFELREMFGFTENKPAAPPSPVIQEKPDEEVPEKRKKIIIPDVVMCLSCGKLNKFTSLICIKCGADLSYAKKNLIGKDAYKRIVGNAGTLGVPLEEQRSIIGVIGIVSVGLANFIFPEIFAPLAILSGLISVMQKKTRIGSIALYIGLLLLFLRLFRVETLSRWLIK